MTRPRLGVEFGTAIYPERAVQETPLLDQAPVAAALQQLERCLGCFRVFIYPAAPSPGRGSAIHGWLVTQLRRYYEENGVDDPAAHAEAAAREIHVCERRPRQLDREVAGADQWPSDADIRALWVEECS